MAYQGMYEDPLAFYYPFAGRAFFVIGQER